MNYYNFCKNVLMLLEIALLALYRKCSLFLTVIVFLKVFFHVLTAYHMPFISYHVCTHKFKFMLSVLTASHHKQSRSVKQDHIYVFVRHHIMFPTKRDSCKHLLLHWWVWLAFAYKIRKNWKMEKKIEKKNIQIK